MVLGKWAFLPMDGLVFYLALREISRGGSSKRIDVCFFEGNFCQMETIGGGLLSLLGLALLFGFGAGIFLASPDISGGGRRATLASGKIASFSVQCFVSAAFAYDDRKLDLLAGDFATGAGFPVDFDIDGHRKCPKFALIWIAF